MRPYTMFILFLGFICSTEGQNPSIYCSNAPLVSDVLERVRVHDFHPLNDKKSLTIDRDLGVAGIADLEDDDWRVRLLAVRDLVKAGKHHPGDVKEIILGLNDESEYVRQVAAMSLGILRAKASVSGLEKLALQDENAIVRSQAIIALGQMESESSLSLLRDKRIHDPSRDVRHQCELAIDQIDKQSGTTNKQIFAYLSLDETLFESVQTGSAAPNFILEDTEGRQWQLNKFRGSKWVVLIWVFADWCPVCHGEFHDLMEMKEEFRKANVQVFTLETHDLYRCRVMVRKELDPEYWFSKESVQEAYTSRIYWPHLQDHAGSVGAMYGIDPLAFAVHAEYINRPATVIIDPDGNVRFIYLGTYWGDLPTIDQTLKMVKTGDFSFEHPKRRKIDKY